MYSLSLTQRMLLVVAVALTPAVGILIANVLTLNDEKSAELHVEALKTAELAALEMERILSGTESVLKVVASAPVVARGDGPECSRFLAKVVKALPFVLSIAITDREGTVWCRPGLEGTSLHISDRPYFREALLTSERVTGVFTLDRLSGRNVLPLALRYEDMGGAAVGVLAAYISLDWLQKTIEERSYTPGSSLTIADRDGRILVRTPAPEKFVGTVIPEGFQRLVNASAPGTEELMSQDGTLRVIGYFPVLSVPKGIYVSAGIASDLAFAPLRRMNAFAATISLLGMISASLLAAYTSRAFILQPFKRLIDTIDAQRAGRTDARASITADKGEIGRIGAALDTFMDELADARAARRKAENSTQMLVAELNHRTKNLLAMVQAIARQTFANVESKAAVATFSGRLMAIASTNSLLGAEKWHAALIEQIVEAAVAPFQDPNVDAFDVLGPSLEVSGDAALAFSMALHELCTNAAKYGALSTDTGRVSITWKVEGDQFSLVWAERNGPPVTKPSRSGFGSKVIKDVLEQKIEGEVELKFASEGLVCKVSAPLASIAAAEADARA